MNNIHRFSNALIGFGLLIGLAGMAGCSTLGGGAYPDRYTLDTPAQTGHKPAAHFNYTLDLQPVSAPDWLDSKRMLYRLDYARASELSAYTQSAWADTPARLVGDNLDQTLSSAGLFAAVLGDTSGRADLALQLQLADFSQHFSAPRASEGRIAVKATLLRAADGQVIAQRRFNLNAPAATPNAAGGVGALGSADAQLNAQLLQWLSQSVQACRPACAASGND